tara:strand:- start:4283 stop:4945 length:663 start_codon:yes stop_codon:yes gene_type:complete
MTFLDAFVILILAFIAGVFLKYLFNKYSNTFSSKVSLGNTILLLTICVASIIAVVKTSLALSLGLVGALSVVRFRTAIKEPYNLVFLLLSICVGISIGASQYVFALMVCIFALFALIYLSKTSTSRKSKLLFRSNDLVLDEIDTVNLMLPSAVILSDLESLLESSTEYYSVVSFDQSYEEMMSVVLRVKISNLNDIEDLKSIIFKKFPGSSFSFYNSISV